MAHEHKNDIYYYQEEKYQCGPAQTEIEYDYCGRKAQTAVEETS
jgi:hypothetical protein